MQVYRGVVRGGVVELTEPADLAEGVEVEVIPVRAANDDELARERAFLETLVAAGAIRSIPALQPDPPALDRTLIESSGPPLSQMIIEERR